jgi:histidine triad (HIT) family protein
MFNPSCIFCKIIQGQIKSDFIKENDFVVAIRDISPKAPTHILLIPKKHVASVVDLQEDDAQYVWHLLKMARDVSKDLCRGKGFNLIANNGADAGQSVFHMHFHFLSGRNIAEGGLKL